MKSAKAATYGNSIPASAKTEGNFIPASAKKKTIKTNMTSYSTGAGHKGNMFAPLTRFTSEEIKSTTVATKPSAHAKATKSASAAKIEFTFGGNTYILPSNPKGSIVNLGDIRICASQLFHLFKKVHPDCASTGSTKCRHPSGLNHHNVCWKSVHGNFCNCDKVHIDLSPFAKIPPRPVEVLADTPLCIPCTPTTVSKPKVVTFTDLLRNGDWPAFSNMCLEQTTYPKATGKTLLCRDVVCFNNCKRGSRCGFAHTTAEQSIDLPTRLVQILGTCDDAAQLTIVKGIREEILTVITENMGQVIVLLAQQAKVTEFDKFTHAKTSQELKKMKKDMDKKTHDSKQLRKLGKIIPDIPLHQLSEASTTDLMKMWWGLASNDHSTFALFGRPPATATFLLEDFVWALTRLCALDPCFTWTFYDEKYIQPKANAANAAAKDEWTTVEKKSQQPMVVVDNKDVCFGGINCKKGRHTHAPIVDIDSLFTPVTVVEKAVIPTADDFTALCKTHTVEPILGNWNTLAAKHLPEPEIVAPKCVTPTPVVKTPAKETVVVVEPLKCKRKKKGPIEVMEDFDGPRAEFNFDDIVAVVKDDFTISADGKVSFTMAESEVTKSPLTKRSNKSRKNKVAVSSTAEVVIQSAEEELMDTPVFNTTRVTIRRPKRAKTGEQLIVDMGSEEGVISLKESLKEQKTPFQHRKKGETVVFSLKSANSFQHVFDALSSAFHKIGIDVDMIRRYDEKGMDFDDCEFTKVVKEDTEDELEKDLVVFNSSKSRFFYTALESESESEESGDEEDQWAGFDIE